MCIIEDMPGCFENFEVERSNKDSPYNSDSSDSSYINEKQENLRIRSSMILFIEA